MSDPVLVPKIQERPRTHTLNKIFEEKATPGT